MLEIFEHKPIITYPDEGKTLVRKFEDERMEVEVVSGYLILLNLYPSTFSYDKPILELMLSPHQMGRIGKYLGSGKWQGGIICPSRSNPDGCYLEELNDQSKYQRILSEIDGHRANIEKNKNAPDYITDYDRRIIPMLEVEALLLKDSLGFGITFGFSHASPRMSIDWSPKDPKAISAEFLEVVKSAYDMSIPEPEKITDLLGWKHKLFEV